MAFSPRSCNNAAHVLAKYGGCMDAGSAMVWKEQFPDFVLVAVVGDLAMASS